MNAGWTVRIERLPIRLAVGVHAHERLPQPLWVSLRLRGRAAALPDELAQCLDYEPLLDWLLRAWPATPHRPLLEMRLNELLDFCFALDARVEAVQAGLYKTRLADGEAAVGLERSLRRSEHQALRARQRARQAADTARSTPHEPVHP